MEPEALAEGRRVELRWPLPCGGWAAGEFDVYAPASVDEDVDDLLTEAKAELAAQVMSAFDVRRVLVYEGGLLSIEVALEERRGGDEEDEAH